MSTAIRIVLLSAAFACGALAIGWWSLPLTAFAWGVASTHTPRPVLTVAICAMIGWGALVLYDATGASFAAVASGVGAVLKISGPAFLELTLIFPFVVAFCAAGAAHALVRKD